MNEMEKEEGTTGSRSSRSSRRTIAIVTAILMVAATMAIVAQPASAQTVEHGGPCPAGAEGSQVPGEWGYRRPTGTSCIFPGTSTPDTTTTTTTAPTAAPPLTPSDNCDYSQADMFNGYGWDNVAIESCPPLDGDGANGNGQAENVDSTLSLIHI